MANWSDCCIELKGSRDNISALTKELEGCIEGEWCSFITSEKFKNRYARGSNGGEIHNIQFNETSIIISMSAIWCGVYEWFKTIVKDYGLTGTYSDKEGGCNFFHLIEAENGKIVKEVNTEYLSVASVEYYGNLESFIEEYQDAYETIEEAEEAISILVKCGADREDLIEKFGLGEE